MPPEAPMPIPMDPMADPEAPVESEIPQFQIDLRTRTGSFVIAASDTVNDLVDRAKAWMGTTDQAGKINDSEVREVALMEVSPETGEYVDMEVLPVEDKKDVITQVRKLGAR